MSMLRPPLLREYVVSKGAAPATAVEHEFAQPSSAAVHVEPSKEILPAAPRYAIRTV